jgi:hypothetical protein
VEQPNPQSSGLIPPALLVESAAVGEYHGAGSLRIEISANSPTVFGGKRDVLLAGHERGQDKSEEQHTEEGDAAIIGGFLPTINELFSISQYPP